MTSTRAHKVHLYAAYRTFSVAACDASVAGSVDIDFGRSFYWNGISAITIQDVNGEFVPPDLGFFSVSSGSVIVKVVVARMFVSRAPFFKF